MCGIWGIFPTDTRGFFQIDSGAIESSMILTSLRGSHSTGICMVGEPKVKPKVVKTLGGPAFLLNTDAWEKIMDFTVKKAKIIFGHGRYATKGAINVKNAHPFTHDHITLVHNGTIHYGLKEVQESIDTEVDSHALCAAIAQQGLVKALESVYGAYALIVHDAKEGCIYIVRNDERPLHRLVLSDKHIVLSEDAACRYLATKLGITNPKVEYFAKHMIYKYDLATAEWSSDDSLVKAMEKKYAPTTPWTDNNNYSKSGGHVTHNKWEKKSGITESVIYCDLVLLCTKIEPIEGTKQHKYFLYDDAGLEYMALSSSNHAHRVGEIARSGKQMKLLDRTTGEVTRFVKYRELEWEKDKPESKAKPEGDTLESPEPLVYKTYNNYVLSPESWKKYIKEQDCAICSGPILEGESEDTILTPNKTLICGDCILKGRHYAFGFGQ